MCGLGWLGRWCGVRKGSSGGYDVCCSTGWARSALFGRVTLLSDVSMGMAETTSDMTMLDSKGIDGKGVKRGMKERK